MPLYEDRTNSENRIKVKDETKNSIVCGNEKVSNEILKIITKLKNAKGSTVKIAIDAWYGVEWSQIIQLIKDGQGNLNIKFESLSDVFKSNEEIEQYKEKFLTDDPGFGWSNTEGAITDIIDSNKFKRYKILSSEKFPPTRRINSI